MFRFDRLIRPSMTVREVKSLYPQTILVFEKFGFHEVCDDCAIEVVSRRGGLSALDVVDALNAAVFKNSETMRANDYVGL